MLQSRLFQINYLLIAGTPFKGDPNRLQPDGKGIKQLFKDIKQLLSEQPQDTTQDTRSGSKPSHSKEDEQIPQEIQQRYTELEGAVAKLTEHLQKLKKILIIITFMNQNLVMIFGQS